MLILVSGHRDQRCQSEFCFASSLQGSHIACNTKAPCAMMRPYLLRYISIWEAKKYLLGAVSKHACVSAYLYFAHVYALKQAQWHPS